MTDSWILLKNSLKISKEILKRIIKTFWEILKLLKGLQKNAGGIPLAVASELHKGLFCKYFRKNSQNDFLERF